MAKGKGRGKQGFGTAGPSRVASSQEITSARVPGGHFREVELLANHFRIRFNDPSATITRYKVEVQVTSYFIVGSIEVTFDTKALKNKSEMRLVVQKLYQQHSTHFPPDKCAYNGSEYIFSANTHDIGEFRVNIPDKCYYYNFKVLEVSPPVQLSKLPEYCDRTMLGKDRDVLFQGLDSIMKESPTKSMIRICRNFYNKRFKRGICSGAAAHTGFKQSLKLTSQGPALCLDYAAVLFYKTNFLHFLQETIRGFERVEDLRRLKGEVERASTGLKLQTTHTNIKYTFGSLTSGNTMDLEFDIKKLGATTETTTVVDYFRTKYQCDIMYKEIPCLILRRQSRESYMPFELCELAEGQMYHNQQLREVKNISVPRPLKRKEEISRTVSDPHGPFSGDVLSGNFGIHVNPHMTVVHGGVIDPPVLKLKAGGRTSSVTVSPVRRDWNYCEKNFTEGKKVHGWALVDLAYVNVNDFITDLRERSSELGMDMDEPLLIRNYHTPDISSIENIKAVVREVVGLCRPHGLQIIIFTVTPGYEYYGYLKWHLETKMGVISQCCLTTTYNEGGKRTMFLNNLCMKINGKIGGSNVELVGRLPHFTDTDLVMFIGADVNHPAAKDTDSLSIAAVVGTVNWPAANRYVARIETQECRNERIVKFGAMCKNIVNTFFQLNNAKPGKIVVFRDGVGEGQFDMVLNDELGDLRRAVFTDDYKPKITVVVAQKRHHTRIFPRGENGNVDPGTVVDTVIVDKSKSDFFLCSHYGAMGTSKPVHYHVLLDENKFPSHDLQKLIYHLCFTYARCTKPVSLVPPVYYADRVATRGRMYYEAARKEKNSNAAASSSSANPSVEGCCKLHLYVENTMFFI